MGELRLARINKILMTGRLTADPNLSYTPDGVPVLKFRIASDRSYKDKSGNWTKSVTYIPVTVWREQAERFGETLHKGSAVFVEGRLQSRSWESEGQRRNIVEISAFRIQNLEKGSFESKEGQEDLKTEEVSEKQEPEDDLPF